MTDTRTAWQRRVGVGERQVPSRHQVGDTRRRPVVADEGVLRGNVVGYNTDHRDGRVDATVATSTITVNHALFQGGSDGDR